MKLALCGTLIIIIIKVPQRASFISIIEGDVCPFRQKAST